MNWIASDHPRTKIKYLLKKTGQDPNQLPESQQEGIFYPTRKIRVPVNKENVLKSGIVKPEDANIAVFRSLQITMTGRKRRIGDLGNVESPDDPMKIQLMIYNKEHIEEVLELIKKNGFPAKNEEGSQFIHIRVPKPSRMQLEELGDDVVRRTNAVIARLVKIKTNTGLRIRAAVEKEFIDQRIAGVATKKIDLNLERCTKEI